MMEWSIARDDCAFSFADAVMLVDEIKRLRQEIARLEARVGELDALAHLDPLVSLPNRRSFLASLERAIARVERYAEPAAMLFVDVDALKAINDQFGHKAGDEALVEIARLLVSSVRNSDTVARLSGDEFAILLEPADELMAWRTTLRVVETVMEARFCVGGRCLPLSVAVGAGAIRRGDSPQSVIERADTAMYRLKSGLMPGQTKRSVHNLLQRSSGTMELTG